MSTDENSLEGNDLHWLAGLLEGEGSFFVSTSGGKRAPAIRISLQMVDREPVEKAAKLMGREVKKYRPYGKNRSPTYTTGMYGSNALETMKKLRPLLSPRRQKQIDRCIEAENDRTETRIQKRIARKRRV